MFAPSTVRRDDDRCAADVKSTGPERNTRHGVFAKRVPDDEL